MKAPFTVLGAIRVRNVPTPPDGIRAGKKTIIIKVTKNTETPPGESRLQKHG